MARNVDTRLRRLEKIKPARIILEVTDDGEARRMTATEFVKAGHDFLQARIVAGSNLTDARQLLSTFPSPGIE